MTEPRPTYPPVDPRRVPELRRQLLRDMAAIAGFWRGAAEAKGADRALVEVAARLFEESTARLDKTPERDALAFFETFDFAPPEPRAAEGHVVFALKEDRTTPVEIKSRAPLEIEARLGVGDAAEPKKAAFETTRPLTIQPGRIDVIASVDPATDTIERAPDAVTALEPDLEPRPRYELQTASPGDSDVIAISPPVGLAKDDMLRVEMLNEPTKFLQIVDVSEDGRCQLTAPIGGNGVARNTVGSITRQTSFDLTAMPNLQEHRFYIGDKDMLNVEEPADITLKFEPPIIGAALIAANARFEIYGTREDDGAASGDEPTPRWHDLVPLARPGDEVVLRKAWKGAVDELKLSEDQEESARYIRIVPKDALTPDAEGTLIDEIDDFRELTIGLKTKLPDEPAGDTISQIAHNGAPLSIASPFNPFGAEPQRFDVFSAAAPETFSKKGATATLKFDMLDATVLAMKASPRSDVRHVFGLSSNGRLQVVDLSGTAPVVRQIDGPTEGDTSVGERFDPSAAFDVSPLDLISGAELSHDLVVATTRDGRAFVGMIEFYTGTDATIDPIRLDGDWRQLPKIEAAGLGEMPDGSVERPGLALLPQQIMATSIQAELIAETSIGFYKIPISSSGVPTATAWAEALPKEASYPTLLSPKVQRIDDADFPDSGNVNAPWSRRGVLTSDANGAIWRMALNGGQYHLQRIGEGQGEVRPIAGLIYNSGARLAVARIVGSQLQLIDLDRTDFASQPTVPEDGPKVPDDERPGTAALALVANEPAEQKPQVFAYVQGGVTGQLVGWDPFGNTHQTIAIADGMTVGPDQPGLPVLGSLTPSNAAPGELVDIVIGGTSQRLQRYTPKSAHLTDQNNGDLLPGQVDWVPLAGRPGDLGELAFAVRRQNLTTTNIDVLIGGSTDAIHMGHIGDDATVAIAPETDWTVDVQVFTGEQTADRSGKIDDADVLTVLDDAALGLADGDFLFVSSTGAAPYTLFIATNVTTDTSTDPDTHTLTLAAAADMTAQEFEDSIDDIGRNTEIKWRKAALSNLLPAEAPKHRQTLLMVKDTDATAFGQILDGDGEGYDLIATEPSGPTNPGFIPVLVNAWSNFDPPDVTRVPVLGRGGQPLPVVAVEISSGFSTPQLSWEYFNGQGWKRLVEGFRDTTSDFASSGEVIFVVPDDLSMAEINGQEDLWIRARLIGGDYGQPKYVVETNGTEQTITVDTSHMRPPEVARLSAAFELPPNHKPGSLIARNNLNDIDITGANGVDGARLTAFQAVFQPPLTPDVGDLPRPPGFSLLIGLTQPLAPGPVSLLVKAREGTPGDPVRVAVLGSDNRWIDAPLSGADPTRGLMLSGLLDFQLPVEPAKVRLVGKSLFWLRLDLTLGAEPPRLDGLWLNGTPVIQQTTINQELVGSILGEPDENFALLNAPVLPNSIELRLREDLSDEQIDVLRAARGDDAVLTDVKNVSGAWVLWNRVDNLLDQPPNARVYLADASGNLTFGSGNNGMLPTAGANKIRAFSYAKGGQRVETEAFAPTSATGSVEGLDQVLAPVAIAGGRDLPKDPELVARIPEVLRHGNQCITLKDIEAMASDLDNEIVQVRAFAPEQQGGKIKIAVLARGKSRNPVYSRASRLTLQRNLGALMSDAFGPDCLDVLNTPIVPFVVDVSLTATFEQSATLNNDASIILRTFLHPAIGGPDGQGWPPGRPIRETDIRRALMSLPNLDRIGTIYVTRDDDTPDAPLKATDVVGVIETRKLRITVTEDAP